MTARQERLWSACRFLRGRPLLPNETNSLGSQSHAPEAEYSHVGQAVAFPMSLSVSANQSPSRSALGIHSRIQADTWSEIRLAPFLTDVPVDESFAAYATHCPGYV